MAMSGRYFKMIDLVSNDQFKEVEKLIKEGGDVNETNDAGYTPIFQAIARNNFEMVKLLIDSGANLEVKDFFGFTPLSLATNLAKVEKSEKIVDLIQESIAKKRLTP